MNFDKLRAAVSQAKQGTPAATKTQDDNVWKVEGDKAKNGSAVIRFLPGKGEDDIVFAKYYEHIIKGPTGKYYWNNCAKTLGPNNPCPVCEANGVLWNSGNKADQEIVRKRKRKLTYAANILVVSDPKNPDNEGKVFIFKFGSKLFDKINDAMNPQFEDETPINPFDPVTGANFKLKMRQVDGYANFDKSGFDTPEPIGTTKEIAKIVDQVHDLTNFINPANHKPYETLKAQFDSIVVGKVAAPKRDDDEDDDEEFVTKVVKSAPAPTPPKKVKEVVEDDDDEMLAEFQRMADED